MSTMLKSAAMSLLSKTLQTFLSKYLSDVDVEGVALPSIYDGYSSGWGVRLSNVKLRDGVQLLPEMPGTLKKKRKRRKKKKTNDDSEIPLQTSQEDGSRSGEVDNDGNIQAEKRSLPEQDLDENDEDDKGSSSEMEVEYEDLKDAQNYSTVNGEHSRSSKPLDVDYYTDDEESAEGGVGVVEATSQQPSHKPLGATKRGLFSCFVKTQYPTKPAKPVGQEGEQAASASGAAATIEADSEMSQHSSSSTTSGLPDDSPEISTTDKNIEIQTTDPQATLNNSAHAHDDNDDEEYEEYEQPMMLRLGEGGRIGTLDARLVEKDLHILVEDAFLMVEAVPISEDSDSEDSKSLEADAEDVDGPKDVKSSMSEDNLKSPRSKGQKGTPKAPPSTGKTTRDTVGDRVLQDIPLARLLSAIPHLFLRDVRIRVVIRAEASEETLPPDYAGPNDTVIEIGVDFFSVSSDDDALSKFQTEEEEEEELENQDVKPTDDSNYQIPMRNIPSFRSEGSMRDDQNEFSFRHMRTGRGPEGGLWLKAFAPQSQAMGGVSRFINIDEAPKWARNVWLRETEYHLFRLSGLDVRARIYLGPKKELDTFSWFYSYDEDQEEYDSYDMDAMFWGVDHVAPGPSLPLPPMTPNLMSRGDTPQKQGTFADFNEEIRSPPSGESLTQQEIAHILHGTENYSVDKNGIQSCHIESNFHRVGRGLVPGPCRCFDHLPGETCETCWQNQDKGSSLDSNLPMPGLVLQITTRDPIEINADRDSLESLGVFQSLLRRVPDQNTQTDNVERGDTKEAPHGGEISQPASQLPSQPSPTDDGSSRTSTTSFFSAFTSKRTTEDIPKEDKSEAFPVYMQPETIQIIGLHISDITVRLHAMKQDRIDDTANRFCFWELQASCFNIDRQQLISDEVLFQDMKLDVGEMIWKEFSGVNASALLSLAPPLFFGKKNKWGTTARKNSSAQKQRGGQEALWPSTAYALLGMPPLLETLKYKDGYQRALQMRYLKVDMPRDPSAAIRSHVDLRIGLAKVDMPWSKRLEVISAQTEATSSIFGDPRENEISGGDTTKKSHHERTPSPQNLETSKQLPTAALMSYKFHVEDASLHLPPLIHVKAPVTQLVGERSSTSGLSIESVLNKLQFSYGEQDRSMRVRRQCLSVVQMGKLPETVRMRIFMFMDDLSPLGEALGLKKEISSFQRFRSINREIVKRAEIFSKLSTSSTQPSEDCSNRRQRLFEELAELEDDDLEKLLAQHKKK